MWAFFFYLADSLLVVVKPKPPVKHLHDGFDGDDDDDELVYINHCY